MARTVKNTGAICFWLAKSKWRWSAAKYLVFYISFWVIWMDPWVSLMDKWEIAVTKEFLHESGVLWCFTTCRRIKPAQMVLSFAILSMADGKWVPLKCGTRCRIVTLFEGPLHLKISGWFPRRYVVSTLCHDELRVKPWSSRGHATLPGWWTNLRQKQGKLVQDDQKTSWQFVQLVKYMQPSCLIWNNGKEPAIRPNPVCVGTVGYFPFTVVFIDARSSSEAIIQAFVMDRICCSGLRRRDPLDR